MSIIKPGQPQTLKINIEFNPATGDLKLKGNARPKAAILMLGHVLTAYSAQMPDEEESNIVLAQPKIDA